MRPITKQEEQRAFQYIKDVLVPKAVQSYNSSPHTERKFTADEIRQVLKKNREIPISPETEGPAIEYFARLPSKTNSNMSHVFGFTVTRDWKGFLRVTCKHPQAASCSDLIQEGWEIDPEVEKRHSLTKMEEDRGLQFIRERIVPNAAVRWNNAVLKSRLQNKEMYRVTAEEINKSLVKKSHYVHNPGDRTRYDHILYQSTPRKPFTFKGPFRFSLSKDQHVGELQVAAALPGSEDFVHYHIDDKSFDGMFNLSSKPIRRGTNIKEALDVPDDPLNIAQFSRREEGEILQYLKLTVIPYLVARKNTMVTQGGRKRASIKFRVEDVQRSLRKVAQNDTKHGRTLSFKAEGQGQTYNLMVYKDGEGDTLVYNRDNAAMYQVGKPIRPDNIDTGEHYEDLMEAGTGPRSITRIEEAELLQNIRIHVIPVAAWIWNQVVKKQHPWRAYGVTTEQISQNLKKTAHGHHAVPDKTTTDVIYYESTIPLQGVVEPPCHFKFQGYKQVNNSNKIVVMITFPNKDTKHVNPKGALTEAKDPTMQPMPERCRLTRREIDEAFQFIKQTVIPRLAIFNNRKNPVDMDSFELIRNLKMIKKGEDTRHVLSVQGDVRTGKARSLNVPYEYVIWRTKGNSIVDFKVEKDFAGNMQLHISANQIHAVPTKIPEMPLLFEVTDFGEPPDESGLQKLSPMEEKQAFQYIKQYLVPIAVQSHNGYSNRPGSVTVKDVIDHLKLSGRYPQHGSENPSVAWVAAWRNQYFAFTANKQLQDVPDKGRIYVWYRTTDQFNPHSHYIDTPPQTMQETMYEAIKVKHAAAPRVISKIEEARAFQYISSVLIPAAFRYYENQVMGEFRVRKEEDIRKVLKKKDVQYHPDTFEEVIHYEALVPTAGGQRVQKFVFYTRKPNRPGMENRTRCGIEVDGYGSQEFFVGAKAIM